MDTETIKELQNVLLPMAREFLEELRATSGKMELLEERVGNIKELANERYESVSLKTQNLFSVFNGLKCSGNEKDLGNLRTQFEALQKEVTSNAKQNGECRLNTSAITKIESRIEQNLKDIATIDKKIDDQRRWVMNIASFVIGGVILAFAIYHFGLK